jgi:hypothetical protein
MILVEGAIVGMGGYPARSELAVLATVDNAKGVTA